MLPPTHQDPDLPPPPPFALSTDLDPSSEVDVDLEADDQGELEEHQLAQDTQAEEIEFMGEAPDLETYFKGQLEDLIDPCIHPLIFDCLDMDLVQRRFEGSHYRYILQSGAVYRAGLPRKSSKDKDHSPGPWMPTRGM